MRILVTKCENCPLVDATDAYEWNELHCELIPPKQLSERSVESVVVGGEKPPDICPLRKGPVKVVLKEE